MKVDYINPFIESVDNLFSTMLDCKTKSGNIGMTMSVDTLQEIVALIGLSGPVRGTVAISFPIKTALSIISRFLDMEIKVMDETVSDGMAEFVNMIAGSAKAKFPQSDGSPIDLSLPTVIRGGGFSIDYPTDVTWLEVPFTSDLGSFSLRVTLEFK